MSKGQAHLSTSLTVPNGHVTSSKEKFPDLPASTEDHQTDETELKSASEVSTECDLYSLSCSALPSARETYDNSVTQSMSAPQLPQREEQEHGGQEGDQEKPVQELVKPVLSEEVPVEQDQNEESKSELEEPVRPDELVQQMEQKGSELTGEESECRAGKEVGSEHRLGEGEQEGGERDGKPCHHQTSEPTETKGTNDVTKGRNDITVVSDDVTTKYETADASAVKAVDDEHGEVDANTDRAIQVNSNIQVTLETAESRGDNGKVGSGGDGEGKVQLGGKEECSQTASQQESAENEESLLDKTEQLEEKMSPASLSLAGEERGEEGGDENTQSNSPSLHKSSETPPTIPEATSTSSDVSLTSSESPLKIESLGENSPLLSGSKHTPHQIHPPTLTHTENLQVAGGGGSPPPTPASIETGTPPSDAALDPTNIHLLATSPNMEQSSLRDNSTLPETAELEREKSVDSFAQSSDPPTLEESPSSEIFSSPDNSMFAEREESTVSSPEPPWSPNTASLARDVQDLLSAVQAPLEEEQMVRVPSISRSNRYYRVSVKGSTPKGSRRGLEEGSTPKLNRHGQEVS